MSSLVALLQTPWIAAGLAALTGYLMGSISFARVMLRLFAPDKELTDTNVAVSWSASGTYHVETASATTASMAGGSKAGGSAFLFDIFKLLIPALVFKLAYPDSYWFLLTLLFGMVGHNWPIYYGFKGGRGYSTLYAGMLLIDPISFLVTNLAGLLVSIYVFRYIFLTFWAGSLLFIPWVALRTHNVWYTLYAIAAYALIAVASQPESQEYEKLKAENRLEDSAMAFEKSGAMWAGMVKIGRRTGSLNGRPSKKPRAAAGPSE
jgi:acyl phosphate:glycerol-3-phosphate acyltransferase